MLWLMRCHSCSVTLPDSITVSAVPASGFVGRRWWIPGAVDRCVIFEQNTAVWGQNATPVGGNLQAVARGPVDLALDASGTVLER